MDGRTSKQCRERWCHHLDPAVRKGGYTAEEDELIIFLQVRLGRAKGRAYGPACARSTHAFVLAAESPSRFRVLGRLGDGS